MDAQNVCPPSGCRHHERVYIWPHPAAATFPRRRGKGSNLRAHLLESSWIMSTTQ